MKRIVLFNTFGKLKSSILLAKVMFFKELILDQIYFCIGKVEVKYYVFLPLQIYNVIKNGLIPR